ncbi:MAG TPA: cytochrome c [Xanthobacteraceae bacterium]|jgi:mono/diheme cytochrome c family protein|nr:cytochrome c [Xanthobacteraceae bacterium]
MFHKIAAVIIVAAVGSIGFWILTRPLSVSATAFAAHTPDLSNGKAMFFAGGCASCHVTPNQEDKTRLGGGLALKTPFGTFYAPNISPDQNDGIGAWSELQFVNALTKGTSPDGKHYYPAFPFPSYQRMNPNDVRDLYAYIKTLPAIQGRAPEHDLFFPFTVRRGIGLWKLLFLDQKPFKPDPSQSAEFNRGAYLIEGPGHCAECHSPRNFLGGIIEAQRFAGGPDPTGEGWVPNITQHALKDWSLKDIEYLLKTGTDPEGDSVGASMAAVVRNMGQLTDADRAAMAAYIKSLSPVAGPKKSEKH